MPTLQEVNAKVDELQTKLDAEQEEIKSAIDTLKSANADLQTQVTAGGSEADRQAVVDKINTVITDLEATVTPDAGSGEGNGGSGTGGGTEGGGTNG